MYPGIDDRNVDPLVGRNDFTLEVNYSSAYWEMNKKYADIICEYYGLGGAKGQIGKIDVVMNKAEYAVKLLPFSVIQPDSDIHQGIYLASCTPEMGGDTMTTTFEVAGDATPTPTISPTPMPTQTPIATLPPIDYANIQSDRVDAGGELSRVTNLCIPDITFNPDGTVIRKCEN